MKVNEGDEDGGYWIFWGVSAMEGRINTQYPIPKKPPPAGLAREALVAEFWVRSRSLARTVRQDMVLLLVALEKNRLLRCHDLKKI